MNRLLVSAAGLALLGGAFAACAQPGVAPARPGASSPHAAPPTPAGNAPVAEVALTGPLPDASLYQIGASWTDQTGRLRHLTDLRGRPQLVAMAFTNCTNACPLTVQDLKRILAGLDASERRRVGVVLVSLDPARDTPEALAMFAAHLQLDQNQWTLLRGDASDVRTLAALLGVRYAPGEGASIAHTNQITVLDREGTTLRRQEGLGEDVSGMVQALRAAL